MFIKKKLETKSMQFILQAFPVVLVLVIFLAMWLSGDDFSIDSLISYTPENHFLAVIFILVMFAAQSLSVFLPCVAMLIVTGRIFAPVPAIILNLVGSALSITIAYWVGYISGSNMTGKLLARYPKAREIIELQRENEWFISYFLRVVNFLPVEAVSMYLGALRITYKKYFLGGMLGMLPGIILATFVGVSIIDPTSMMFIVSVSISLTLSVTSFVVYSIIYRNNKRKKLNSPMHDLETNSSLAD